MNISKPNLADIEALIPLCEQQCNYHHEMDSHYYAAASEECNQEYRELLQKGIEQNDPHVLMAKNEESITGFITYSIVDNDYADTNVKQYGYIQELIVDANYRGKGVGSALMQAAEQFFSEQAITDVMVSTSAANAPGITFFKKNGYHAKRLYMFKNIDTITVD